MSLRVSEWRNTTAERMIIIIKMIIKYGMESYLFAL